MTAATAGMQETMMPIVFSMILDLMIASAAAAGEKKKKKGGGGVGGGGGGGGGGGCSRHYKYRHGEPGDIGRRL